MPESAEEVYARVVAAVGEDGRLPMPPTHEWDMFPWEGAMRPKVVQPPLAAEPPRAPFEHFDFSDMDDEQAAEYGRISNWLHRIMEHMPNIGRVHV